MEEMKEWHVALGAVSAFLGPTLIMELLSPHIEGWSGLFLIGGWGLVRAGAPLPRQRKRSGG